MTSFHLWSTVASLFLKIMIALNYLNTKNTTYFSMLSVCSNLKKMPFVNFIDKKVSTCIFKGQ